MLIQSLTWCVEKTQLRVAVGSSVDFHSLIAYTLMVSDQEAITICYKNCSALVNITTQICVLYSWKLLGISCTSLKKIYNSDFPHIFSLPLDCKQPVCGLWHTWFFKISVILQPPIWSCFSILNFVTARVWNHEVVEFIWAESNHTTLGLMISQWHSMALVLLHHQVLSTFSSSR